MSRWKIVYKWLVNVLYPQYTLFISRLYPIYQPFTNSFGTSKHALGLKPWLHSTHGELKPCRTSPKTYRFLLGCQAALALCRPLEMEPWTNCLCFFFPFFLRVCVNIPRIVYILFFMKRIPINLHGIHCESAFNFGPNAIGPFSFYWGDRSSPNPKDFIETFELFNNKKQTPRWWFQICFIFTPIWGRFPCWLIFFGWVETAQQRTWGWTCSLKSAVLICQVGPKENRQDTGKTPWNEQR